MIIKIFFEVIGLYGFDGVELEEMPISFVINTWR
jgi:hypothetical protein